MNQFTEDEICAYINFLKAFSKAGIIEISEEEIERLEAENKTATVPPMSGREGKR